LSHLCLHMCLLVNAEGSVAHFRRRASPLHDALLFHAGSLPTSRNCGKGCVMFTSKLLGIPSLHAQTGKHCTGELLPCQALDLGAAVRIAWAVSPMHCCCPFQRGIWAHCSTGSLTLCVCCCSGARQSRVSPLSVRTISADRRADVAGGYVVSHGRCNGSSIAKAS
jgi:hypothetical protein